MDDKKLTQSRLQDLAGQREKYQTVVFTKFLSEQQQLLAACHQNVCFWGGWPEAERKCAAFYPDSLTPEEIQWPVSVIQISPTDGAPLTHRDYLGSLLALGLKREVLGDLLVAPENALLFHLENITDYLAQNLKTVSRSSVKVTCLSVSEVVVPARCFETLTGSVASLRLDNVVGVAVKKSRALAQELISAGLVQVGHETVLHASRPVRPGDVLSLRCYGKFIFDGTVSTTKKGRCLISIRKYI